MNNNNNNTNKITKDSEPKADMSILDKLKSSDTLVNNTNLNGKLRYRLFFLSYIYIIIKLINTFPPFQFQRRGSTAVKGHL